MSSKPTRMISRWQIIPFIKGAKERTAKSMAEIAGGVNWGGSIIVGTGAWVPEGFVDHDPETGEMKAVAAISFGACLVEVEVDTDTGFVDIKKIYQAWEVGKAINPALCRNQINGGLQIGLGFATLETSNPYYPTVENMPDNLGDYFMPTFADYPPEMYAGITEVPHPKGVKGAKGFSEGSSSTPPPAILSAVHDAVGIWLNEFPSTPEVVLRALKEKEAQG